MKKVQIKKKKVRKKGIFNRFGFTPVYLVALILVAAIALAVIVSKIDRPTNNHLNFNITGQRSSKDNNFKKFTSLEEFKVYVEEMDQNTAYYGMGMARDLVKTDVMMNESDVVAAPTMGMDSTEGPRFSDTNVQVLGIDEADIVKTNGKQIYYSDNIGNYWLSSPVASPRVMDSFVDVAPDVEFKNESKISIINAWPVSDLALSSKIDLSGDLLLVGNTLVVLSGQDIVAYDVADPSSPNQKWNIKLDEQSYLITSRLYDNKIYLVTQTYLNRYNPCPIKPLFLGEESMIVPCTDIYYPSNPSQVDSTFTAISIDPNTGKFENKISFVGSQSSANIYMSKDALYIAYNQNLDMFDFMFDFVGTQMNDLAPANVLAKLNKLNTYDISKQSKLNELQTILDEWMQSLNKDEMLRVENEMSNRSEKYYEKNKRSLLTTGIAKIDINNLELKASASVPGYLLNQFSMDEYDGYLRLATTIGNSWGWGWGIGASDSQANDVYVLDSDLKIKGSIENLGISERIYSARFIGEKAYLVTFRQVDPFYVLDLSNPKDPKMVGELKIPGYSSYLHPLAKDRILGIGMEDRKVKISYFDVSDPTNPQEIAKYSLDEYGSDALYNHHAFLQDASHQVFFLPSYQGGYVFSYANDNLELVRTINLDNVQRALYIGDYMYIMANDYVAILNENDWEKVNDLDL